MNANFKPENIKHMYFAADQKNACSKRVAIIEMNSGTKYIRSYNTIVARIDRTGKLHRLWDDYSVTTLKHVNIACDRYGVETLNKKAWLAMPIEKINVWNIEKWLNENVGYWKFYLENGYCTRFVRG